MKIYTFNTIPTRVFCGGGGAPPPPPPPPPPPQYSKVPEAPAVRASTTQQNLAQGGGQITGSLLTGGQGDTTGLDKLGKKTLLGS